VAAALIAALVAVAHAEESGQTITYLLCFFVVLPGVVAASPWLERTLAELPGPTASIVSAGAATAGLTVLFAARAATAGGADCAPVLIGGAVMWCLAGVVGLRAVRSGRARRLREAPAGIATLAWAATAGMLAAGILAFVPGRLRAGGPLAVSLLVGGGLMALVLGATRLRLRRGVGLGLDAVAVGVIVLGVVDASFFLHFSHDAAGRPAALGADSFGLQLLHEGFYLGPVNDVLHGRTVLVDTYSQYGVGVIYFLAAIFKLVPIGYGPLGLISGALTGVAYASGYTVLRIAGCTVVTGAIALAVGIATTGLDVVGSVAGFPSVGALRFGPAYLLILVIAARARWRSHARELRAAELLVVGVSAVWSAEALAYALAIVMAAAGIEAATAPGARGDRVRRWLASVARAVVAVVAAIVLLELITRLSAGRWPDWSSYVALLTSYSSRTVPGVTVFPPIAAWSTGFAVAGVYLVSAVSVIRLAGHAEGDPSLRRRLIAGAAMTAFGVVSLSYWITHGAPFALRWVALPAVLVLALWIDLIARSEAFIPRGWRLAGVGFVSWLAALALVFSWSSVHETGERTALVHALPGSPSLRGDVGSLWHSPRVDPRSLEGELLLLRFAPGRAAVAVLTEGTLGLEILMRSGRANALPLGHPLQLTLIPRRALARLRPAIARLPAGTLALIDVGKAAQTDPHPNAVLRDTLALLMRRFTGRVVARGQSGLLLLRLEPRRGVPARPTPSD
jgi:hypothetical protein